MLAGCQTTEPEAAVTPEATPPAVPEWALEQCGELAKPLVAAQHSQLDIGELACDPETGRIIILTASHPRDYWGQFYETGAFAIDGGQVCVRVTHGETLDRWDVCVPLTPPIDPIG